MKIRVAHTPDADDAFMFYAMTHGKLDTWLEVEHVIEDIETLNRKASRGFMKLLPSPLTLTLYSTTSIEFSLLERVLGTATGQLL